MTSNIIDLGNRSSGLWLGRATRHARNVLLLLALLLAGCSSSASSVTLEVTAPAADQTLTIKQDDKDIDKPGLQFDVAGRSKGISANTALYLFVDDQKQAVDAKVKSNGDVLIPGVTLPPGTHNLYLQTSTASASSNQKQKYTLKALVISAPDNGAIIDAKKDEDSSLDGIQISVTVDAFAVDLTQKITLMVDGQDAGSKAPDSKGRAAFSGITLISGSHTLLAQVPDGGGSIESSEVKVQVQESCAAITFISPAVPASGQSVTFGGTGKCPANAKDPFTARVEISTDAGSGRPVHVIVNGQQAISGKVSGATAAFDGVVFNKAMNTLEVQVENSNGDLCSQKFPVGIAVDCAGPDCAIASPVPVPYVDFGGNTTLFLNHALTAAGNVGFDVQVASSADIVGKDVQLILDGNSRKPLTVPAAADGKGSSALFRTVALAEGAHTLEALCTDAAGNVASSGEYSWVVDTKPCSVGITDPTADTLLVPADDTDSGSTGTQVVASSTVTGSQCVGQRAKVCDPASGVTGADFTSYDGTSPLLSTVTLDDGLTDQSLCVEIEDQAGNIGRSNVAVVFHGATPKVKIESPSDGTKFNVAGGTGYVADADPSSASTCDAAFSIACTEIGAQVELHRTTSAGALVAMAECKPRQAGDPVIPSGYAGRAKLTVAPFEDPSIDATVVATQTVTGNSTKTISGSSDAVTLHGDCKAPLLVFTDDPCGSTKGNQLTTAQAASREVAVVDATRDVTSASLSYSHTDTGGTTTNSAVPTSTGTNSATFAAVNLGGAGSAMLTVTVTDAFGNSAAATCSTSIVTDLPSIVAIAAPPATHDFGPGQQTCNAGTGKYGVLVQATADKQANRAASVSVNGTVVANNLTIASNGTFQACVAVTDDEANATPGPSTITISLTSTIGAGRDDVPRTASVHTLLTTSPNDNATLLAGDANKCGSTTYGYQVVVNVDPSLNGQTYMIASGAGSVTGTVSGAQISGCVALAQGPNAITASISGSPVMNAVHVTVDSVAPTHPIVINPKPTPDAASTTYRDGVTASWSKPTEDWTGQLVSYQMHCKDSAVTAGSEEAWWSGGTAVALPSALLPSTANPSALLAFRPEELHHCVVRALDGAGLMTPITTSTDLTLKLRQQVMFAASTAVQFGASIAAVGDVDGDANKIGDFLVGGIGRAQLFFGQSGDPSSAKSVVFLSSSTSVGLSVAGIGDFDGDGLNDFAISDPVWNGFTGRVSIFFGRSQAQWQAIGSVANISDTSSCQADLCLNGTGTGAFGWSVAPAGDFDGDGTSDLAIGSKYYPSLQNTDGQLLVVLGSKYYDRTCASSTECRTSETCQAGKCTLNAGRTFWQMQFQLPSGNWTDTPSGTPVALLDGFEFESGGSLGGLGTSIASLGKFDATAGADLAVSAPNIGQVLYLSGRTHSGSTGLDLLHASDFGLRNVTTHVPSGMPLATGSSTDKFGSLLGAVGDVYSVPGATKAAPDLAVCGSLVDYMTFLPGDAQSASDPGFSATAINIAGDGGYISQSVATGLHPVYGLLGDLDSDGHADLLAGTTYPKDAMLFYADTFASKVAGGVHKAAGVSIKLQAETTNTANLNVQYVGDFNNDGHLDLVIGDPRAGTTSGTYLGQAILLY
jgi:hypothetical protein